MEEARANRGVKVHDPFTRRSTQPTMSFKRKENTEDLPTVMFEPPPPPGKKDGVDQKKTSNGPSTENNLYSLHDFDIDLDVPLPGKTVLPIFLQLTIHFCSSFISVSTVNVVPKPLEKIKETAPKRSLNLEDYKKKRGLI